MNEFNKKYLQIAKSYNYKPNELIQEGILDDAGNFIKGKAKLLYNKLVNTVQSWFNNCKDQKTAKEYSEKAKKLVGIEENQDNIITQFIGGIFAILPILKKFDWFNKICNIVKKYCKVFTTNEEKNNFIKYMKIDKKISNEQYKQMGYFDKQKELYNFVLSSIEKQKIVSENTIITEEPFSGFIGLLVVLIIGFIIFIYCDRNYLGWTPSGKAALARKQQERKEQHKKKMATLERERKQHELAEKQKLDQLNLKELTNLLKGCTALQ